MNRVLNFAVAAVASSIVFTGVSYAESLAMNDGPQIEKTLQTFNSNFDVKYLNDYQNQRDQPNAEDTNIPRTVAGVHNIQASIKENKALTRRLDERGIDIDNVVNAQQAADGSITFWIR